MAVTIDLGKGWSARIERHGTGEGYQRHLHIYNGKQSWAQNEDGSPHDDGNNSSGPPPKKVLKVLKDKKGWDWNAKENDWINKCDIFLDIGGIYVITYPDGSTGYVPKNSLLSQGPRPYNYEIVGEYLDIQENNTTVIPSVYITPVPSTVPVPTLSPTLIPAIP